MWPCYGSQLAIVPDPDTSTGIAYRPNAEPISFGEDDVLDIENLQPGFSTQVWRLFRRRR